MANETDGHRPSSSAQRLTLASLPNGEDVRVSPICLGTGSFGSAISREDSFALLDTYAEHGGNFLDSAHIYAAWIEGGEGASESTIGEWLRANGNRNDIVIGTKGGHPPLDDMMEGRCSPEDLNQDLNESLERLGTDHVDVYWLHRDDPTRPAGEIVETLACFVCDGRVRSYGVSNWPVVRIEEANAYARDHDLPPLVANQPGWALAAAPESLEFVAGMRYADHDTVEWHAENRFPLVAYSAQAGGYFGEENVAWAHGGFDGPTPRGASYDTHKNRWRLLRAIDLAKADGLTPNQVALAYLLNHPFPVVPIIGTSKPKRVAEAMDAIKAPFRDDERDILRRAAH